MRNLSPYEINLGSTWYLVHSGLLVWDGHTRSREHMWTPKPSSKLSWKKVLAWATNQESQCCNHLVERLNLQHREEGLCYGTYPLAKNFCFATRLLLLCDISVGGPVQDPAVLVSGVLLSKLMFLWSVAIVMLTHLEGDSKESHRQHLLDLFSCAVSFDDNWSLVSSSTLYDWNMSWREIMVF
jgi:hypothetical protein